MGKVIEVDFLFRRLCKDITAFYDNYYFGQDIDKRKNVHLAMLQERYTSTKFSTDPILRGEQIKDFLTLIQGSVDGYTF